MNKKNYSVIDHLGDDFEKQKLVERKKRIDAQINEYIRLYTLNGLTLKEEDLIYSTLINLLEMQRIHVAKIKLISAICMN